MAKKAIKCRGAALVCLLLRVALTLTLLRLLLVNVALIVTAQLFFAADLFVECIQVVFCFIPLSALLFSPGCVFRDTLMQSAHLAGNGVTFLLQFMQFHGFSLRVKKSQHALARRSLVNGLRQRAAVARLLPGFHGANSGIGILISRIGHRTYIKEP